MLCDFLFIDDLIDAIIKSLKNDKSTGEIINLGTGKPIKIKDLITKICNLVGSGRPEFGKVKLRKDEIKKLYPKILKSKKFPTPKKQTKYQEIPKLHQMFSNF